MLEQKKEFTHLDSWEQLNILCVVNCVCKLTDVCNICNWMLEERVGFFLQSVWDIQQIFKFNPYISLWALQQAWRRLTLVHKQVQNDQSALHTATGMHREPPCTGPPY